MEEKAGGSKRARHSLNRISSLSKSNIAWEIKLRLCYVIVNEYKKHSKIETAKAINELLNQFRSSIKIAKFNSPDIIKNGLFSLERVYNKISSNGQLAEKDLFYIIDAINESIFVDRVNKVNH